MKSNRLKYIFLFLFALLKTGFSLAQDYYFTHPLVSEVKTLRCRVDGDFMRPPVIDLQERSSLEIDFDIITTERKWISYRVIHCDANWQASNISELDYLDGFLPVRVDDVRPSFNTFVSYYHYSVSFPNDDVKLLISGNYAIEFFEDDRPDVPIAIATFAVSEGGVFIRGEASADTDIDYRDKHQQLACAVSWNSTQFPYVDPYTDYKLVIIQNGRLSTRRLLTRPLRATSGSAYYEHDEALIFPAGNNYRRFEFTDERYTSIGVEQLEYRPPYYHLWVIPDRIKAGSSYFYDRDQRGRFLVHALRVDDVDVEADYFWAHFSLNCTKQWRNMGVWLDGLMTYNSYNADNAMVYDESDERYYASLFLKQGSYNYQYLVGDPEDLSTMQTSPIEGDYYETPNEYSVWLYYCPSGGRYDRLVGFTTIVAKP